jgi:hypothetical protein
MIKQISLKVGHIHYIAKHIKNMSASVIFDTLYEFKNKLKAQSYSDDDIISVDIDLNTVFSVYTIIAGINHVQAKHINGEMSDILMPQLLSIKMAAEAVLQSDSENEQALQEVDIINRFIAFEQAAIDAVASDKAEGKAWLLS